MLSVDLYHAVFLPLQLILVLKPRPALFQAGPFLRIDYEALKLQWRKGGPDKMVTALSRSTPWHNLIIRGKHCKSSKWKTIFLYTYRDIPISQAICIPRLASFYNGAETDSQYKKHYLSTAGLWKRTLPFDPAKGQIIVTSQSVPSA